MSIVLPDCVNHTNAMALQNQGFDQLQKSQTVDCGTLKDFDSSVLAVLMAWQRRLAISNQKIMVLNPPNKLKVLASVYGVSELLGLN